MEERTNDPNRINISPVEQTYADSAEDELLFLIGQNGEPHFGNEATKQTRKTQHVFCFMKKTQATHLVFAL